MALPLFGSMERWRCIRRLLFISIALWLAAGPVASQDLAVGSMWFQLGQDQLTTMKEVSARFTVVPVTGQPNTFFLSEAKPPNVRVIGGIEFKEGKLTWIQRSWGNFIGLDSATDAAKAIYGALESASSASGTSATISTRVQRVPDIEFKTVTLDFGRRRVTISSTDATPNAGGKQVDVTESVRAQ